MTAKTKTTRTSSESAPAGVGPQRRIEYRPLGDLAPNPLNPKLHSIEDLRESLGRFAFTEPILIDERTGLIVAGHGRREILLDLKGRGEPPPAGVDVDGEGDWLVPVVLGWSSADDDEAEAYLIASNQITTAGGWRPSMLIDSLDRIRERTTQGLSGTAVSVAALESLKSQVAERMKRQAHQQYEPTDDADTPGADRVRRVTQRGDVWRLGDSLLMCGDCRDPADVERLAGGRLVNLAFTSPPYADRRAYDPESGFEPVHPDSYVEWFEPVQANVAAHLADGGSWFVNIKPSIRADDQLQTELYVFDLVLAHARRWGWLYATEFCWERNGVPKAVHLRFKNRFEPIYQFARGRWKIRPDSVRHPSDNVPVPLGKGAGATTWTGTGGGYQQGDGGGHHDMPPGRHDEMTHGEPGAAWFRGRAMQGEAPNAGLDRSLAAAQGGNAPLIYPEQNMRPRAAGVGRVTSVKENQGENWAPGEALTGGLAYPGNRLPAFGGPRPVSETADARSPRFANADGSDRHQGDSGGDTALREEGLAYPGNRLPTFSRTHEALGHAAAFPVGLPEWFVLAYTDEGDVVYDPFAGTGSTLLAAHARGRVGLGVELSALYCDIVCARFQRHTGIVPVRDADEQHVDFLSLDP